MPFSNKQKAQGAIEYLLIIGSAILVVAVVIVALSGVLNTGTTDTNEQTTAFNTSTNIMRGFGYLVSCRK
jgi:amino acid permease